MSLDKQVGYKIQRKVASIGTEGEAYTYIMAQNGLWLDAWKPIGELYIGATIPLMAEEVTVRGLEPVGFNLRLPGGPIPEYLWAQAKAVLIAAAPLEKYIAIVWDDERQEYALQEASQLTTGVSVQYHMPANIVVDLHSHNYMPAFFSGTDDEDDSGFRVSIVIGKVDEAEPEVLCRVGVYGYFCEVNLDDVFDLEEVVNE